jgi:formamidopyrimidine-DNA glycosylase
MPELPEVETIRRQLVRVVGGATIKEVLVKFAGRLNLPAKKFSQLLGGKKIIGVDRRAKLLIFKLSGGLFILAHLKMSGRFLVKGFEGTRRDGRGFEGIEDRHTHVVFKLSGNRELHWNDFRKFGFLKVVDKKGLEKYLAGQNYGPEPLEKSFTWKKMVACLRVRPRAKIKPALLDQRCIAGIGNIYATEALWLAKFHPLTMIGKISDAEMRALHCGVVSVMKKSIVARGTSADAYLDVFGKEGNFEKKLKVYGREGKPCFRCRTLLKKMRVGGRGTAFCPKCQAVP